MSSQELANSIVESVNGMRAYDLMEVVDHMRDRLTVVKFNSEANSQPSQCGAWVDLGELDLIYLDSQLTGILRQHFLIHQIAHIMLGHRVVSDQLQARARKEAPSLHAATIAELIGQSAYSKTQEADAESVAAHVMTNTGGPVRMAWDRNPRATNLSLVLEELNPPPPLPEKEKKRRWWRRNKSASASTDANASGGG